MKKMVKWSNVKKYERFWQKSFGLFKDCSDGTPLVGKCVYVGCIADTDGYNWRGFTAENFKKYEHLSNEEIYKMFGSSCTLLE